tara:strand:+ start:1285 stop:1611 length:327 start_codon:yes stop_codon:yes gene_type:complete
MRAGNDIGYCDSEHPKAPFEWCEKDIEANLEALGFSLYDVNLSDYKMDLYITDKETNVAYDFYNLEYYFFENFLREDYLKEYDERWSGCCGSELLDCGICKHCKEIVL